MAKSKKGSTKKDTKTKTKTTTKSSSSGTGNKKSEKTSGSDAAKKAAMERSKKAKQKKDVSSTEGARIIAKENKEEEAPSEVFENYSGKGGENALSSMLDDMQSKYGGISESQGRRGSAARNILANQGDEVTRSFMGTELYQSILDNPDIVKDRNIQNQLEGAGIDWKRFVSGKKGNQGSDVVTSFDSQGFKDYMEALATPYSLLGGDGGASNNTGSNVSVSASSVSGPSNQTGRDNGKIFNNILEGNQSVVPKIGDLGIPKEKKKTPMKRI